MAVERRLRAMGTDLTVIVVGPEHLADTAVDRITQLEARWSRFRPDSEISRLNGAVGAPVEVSADTVTLLRRAVEAWQLSDGLVDCTQLAELVEAGYDRSFEQLAPTTSPISGSTSHGSAEVLRRFYGGDPADIEIAGTSVRLPLGLGVDPGGIGKGLAADLVSAEVMAAGADGVCINLGGDLRVRGTGPRGGGWTIAVDGPEPSSRPLVLLGLHGGAVATSTTLRRRWSVDGHERHHLIDPRSGRPSRSGIVLATAVAAEGWQAETVAKAVLLRGESSPLRSVAGTGAEALAVAVDGTVTWSPGFTRFTGGANPAAHLGDGQPTNRADRRPAYEEARS